jgi:hypothetical protein
LHGFLLWPGVVLHSLISISLLSQFQPDHRTPGNYP